MTDNGLTPLARNILADLPAHARQELVAVLHDLHTLAASTPTGETVDYDDMNALLQRVSPDTRNAIRMLHDLTGTERDKPFDPRMTLDNWADALGMDANALGKVRSTLLTAEIARGLADRMGEPSSPAPMSDSEHRSRAIRHAVDQDYPQRVVTRVINDDLRASGEQIHTNYGEKSLRETIKALMEAKQ